MVDSQYQSVLVRADTLELHVEATLVMQEHAGAIAVDRTVREQHTNGECGLHVLRQRRNAWWASQYGSYTTAAPARRRNRSHPR